MEPTSQATVAESGDSSSHGETAAPEKKRKQRKLFKPSERVHSLTGVQILGTGSYVPARIVTNGELEEQYGFPPGWIEQRTGIRERRYADEKEATSDLCVAAALQAFDAAGVKASDVDLVLVGTFTPDFQCPSTACLVQERLGIDAPAVDLHAACAGFMYALSTGMQYVATGNSRLALVIGADVNSRIVEPSDQGTAPLFGDGAGAVLLGKGSSDQGLICYQLGSDGSGAGLLDRPTGGTKNPACVEDVADGKHFLQMDGRNVFKWAVQAVENTINLVLRKSNVEPMDVSLYILHQANMRIISHAMEQLDIPEDKVYCNLQKYGNTSGGSIPLALDEAFRSGKVSKGDLIAMCGFGAGLTWGTGLFRW